jgi:very-short-patch-repair endonuclease
VPPQVAVSQILRASGKDRAGFFAINKLLVDFLIVSESFKVLAVVELDGRSHGSEQQRERDARKNAAFESACIKIHRVSHPKLPEVAEIRQWLNLGGQQN